LTTANLQGSLWQNTNAVVSGHKNETLFFRMAEKKIFCVQKGMLEK
jgi:hypothetical protein